MKLIYVPYDHYTWLKEKNTSYLWLSHWSEFQNIVSLSVLCVFYVKCRCIPYLWVLHCFEFQKTVSLLVLCVFCVISLVLCIFCVKWLCCVSFVSNADDASSLLNKRRTSTTDKRQCSAGQTKKKSGLNQSSIFTLFSLEWFFRKFGKFVEILRKKNNRQQPMQCGAASQTKEKSSLNQSYIFTLSSLMSFSRKFGKFVEISRKRTTAANALQWVRQRMLR